MKSIGLALVFVASFSIAQAPAPIQLTQVPPKPTCNAAALPLFGGGPECKNQWDFYNQAVLQRARQEIQNYANRQKDIATAPLQQQIDSLQKLSDDEQQQIKKLTDQIQADNAARSEDAAVALQAKNAAHTSGLEQGAGGMVVLVGLVFGIKKLTENFSVTKKPQAKAASA